MKKKLTIKELEKLSGVSSSGIQRIESGLSESPGIQTLLNLSKALNVPIMSLILAYQGKDPDSESAKSYKNDESQQIVNALLKDLLGKIIEHIPKEQLYSILLDLAGGYINLLEQEFRK